MKTLNQYAYEAYKIAKEHGWHDEEHSSEHFICLVISELMEAVQADRKEKYAILWEFHDHLERYNDFNRSFELCIKDTKEDEIADALIRCFDLAGYAKENLPESLKDSCQFIFSKGKGKTFTEYTMYIIRYLSENASELIQGILALARMYEIDIFTYVDLKMQYNKTREYKHGKRY